MESLLPAATSQGRSKLPSLLLLLMISPSRSVVDSTMTGVRGDIGGLSSSLTVRLSSPSFAVVSSSSVLFSLLSTVEVGSLTTGVEGASLVFVSLIAAVCGLTK